MSTKDPKLPNKRKAVPREVFAYLITRKVTEPFYALFCNGDGATWTRIEYENVAVKYCYFLETRDAIQFLLAAADCAYHIVPIFDATAISERRKKYYEAQGISISGAL